MIRHKYVEVLDIAVNNIIKCLDNDVFSCFIDF